MLFLATAARAGYFSSIVTGLTWSTRAPTMHRWRRIRLKSSVVARERENHRAR